jgi:DNA modification methylase
MVNRLSPYWTVPTSLHGGNALIAGWNCDRQSVPHSISNSVELIDHLATKFSFVYDPCCGYGNACVAFFLAGKRFLGCDINRKCIGVLASRVGFSPSQPPSPKNSTP